MTAKADDVVKVATGDMVMIELHKQSLAEAGIEARVVGEALGSSFGSAIPGSVELWVHRSDLKRAKKVIDGVDEEADKPKRETAHFPHPESDPLPKGAKDHGTHTHYNPDPRS